MISRDSYDKLNPQQYQLVGEGPIRFFSNNTTSARADDLHMTIFDIGAHQDVKNGYVEITAEHLVYSHFSKIVLEDYLTKFFEAMLAIREREKAPGNAKKHDKKIQEYIQIGFVEIFVKGAFLFSDDEQRKSTYTWARKKLDDLIKAHNEANPECKFEMDWANIDGLQLSQWIARISEVTTAEKTRKFCLDTFQRNINTLCEANPDDVFLLNIQKQVKDVKIVTSPQASQATQDSTEAKSISVKLEDFNKLYSVLSYSALFGAAVLANKLLNSNAQPFFSDISLACATYAAVGTMLPVLNSNKSSGAFKAVLATTAIAGIALYGAHLIGGDVGEMAHNVMAHIPNLEPTAGKIACLFSGFLLANMQSEQPSK